MSSISDKLGASSGGTRWVTAKGHPLLLQINCQIRQEFHGATIVSDAELLALRQQDDALDLTPNTSGCLHKSRTGYGMPHHPIPQFRLFIYTRIAGYSRIADYDDTEIPMMENVFPGIQPWVWPWARKAQTRMPAGSG